MQKNGGPTSQFCGLNELEKRSRLSEIKNSPIDLRASTDADIFMPGEEEHMFENEPLNLNELETFLKGLLKLRSAVDEINTLE